MTLDFLEGASTLGRLNERLLHQQFHILHFIGHGAYHPEYSEGTLIMEDETRYSMPVRGELIGMVLGAKRSLRLVVLNACQGTVSSAADPWTSVAASLVNAGVPAVIAMQFEITDDAAITLSRAFYHALALGFPVDAALTHARRQIVAECPDSIEWATPVLFMRARDGKLFDLSAARAPKEKRGLPTQEAVPTDDETERNLDDPLPEQRHDPSPRLGDLSRCCEPGGLCGGGTPC